jgi:hypothetical protein
MEKTQLKANRFELKLRSLAEKALDAVKEVLDYKYGDRHGSYIAFDCKVHEWLDTDDVKDIIQKSKMSFGQIRQTLETFTNSRLTGTFYHILEDNATYFKDWAGGCSYSTKKDITENLARYSDPITCPYPVLRDILRKKRTHATREKAVYAFFQSGFDALEKLSLIDEKEFGQFGRSGGHYAIAQASEFKEYHDKLEYFIDNAFSGNDILLRSNTTRAEWHDNLDCNFELDINSIQSIIEHCEAISFVIEEGESTVKGMNKEYFLERLREEIESEVGAFEVVTDEEVLAKWINHQGSLRTTARSYSFLRLSKDKTHVQTSQNLCIPIDKAIELYSKLALLNPMEATQLTDSIERFPLNHFGMAKGFQEPVLIAGCHKIKWDFIKEFYQNNLVTI